MRFLTILIVSVLVLESLSLIAKTKNTTLLAKKMTVKKGGRMHDLTGYPEQILRELNHYRRKNHFYPRIHWHNPLAATAGREAQSIINKHSFGQHANFYNWKRTINSKYFTELALIVDTEGWMPPKRIFAKTILEALKQEQEWYLIHGYTHAGVAILPGKRRNIYVVAIHLIRRPSRFRSCAEARNYGYRPSKMTIFPRGKKVKVQCNNRIAGGGWTLVLDMAQQRHGGVVQGINDRGLRYSQILFQAKPRYWFDYAKGGRGGANGAWDFNGYVFPLNALRFNDKWYMSAQAPTHQGLRNGLPHIYYNLKDKNTVQIIQRASRCVFGRTHRPFFCARQFILKKLPKGRLNAISDVESLRRHTLGDNEWRQYYKLYLR